ncbi:hypothetical protein [Psychrobium sp. 1_MG-2023]|nr:hypothetical protein [Psychrobium sp. 1_MG-2023]MDP2560261.1 hypothetical protein [Psychrobium sp. 1_MG-2023]
MISCQSYIIIVFSLLCSGCASIVANQITRPQPRNYRKSSRHCAP